MQTPRDVWQEIKDDADLATTKLMFEVEHSDVKWRVEDGQRLNGKVSQCRDTICCSLSLTGCEQYRAENAFGPYTRWELGLSSSLSSPLMTTPHKRAASKEISEEPAKILKAENHHFTCIVCLDNYDLEQGVHAPCGEFYCDEDLTELFRNAMTEAPIHLPRCCGQVVPYEMVGDHLEVNLAEAFYQKMEELGDRRRVYCHKCSTYISEKNRNAILATCSICRAGTCVLCHRATHAGPCIIGKGAEGFLQLAKAKGWQICYSCETMVERDDGCNHMT